MKLRFLGPLTVILKFKLRLSAGVDHDVDANPRSIIDLLEVLRLFSWPFRQSTINIAEVHLKEAR